MKNKIIIASLLTIALVGCSNKEDSKAYLGYWKNANRNHIVLEITDKGSNQYLLKQLDLHAGPGFPPRKTIAAMRDGELMIGGVEPVRILKDGNLFYTGREFMRQTDAEVTKMKQTTMWQYYNKP